MSRICEGLREMMLDHALEELDGLKAARLEAHLVNCTPCRDLHTRLQEGLKAAKNFEPEIGEADLERLVAQVAPFFRESSERSWRVPRFALALSGAVAAVLGALWFIPGASSSKVESTPRVVEAPAEVVRKVLSPRLRVVASEDFDGEFERASGPQDILRMSRGFAVLHYEGGSRKPLLVHAPGVRISVLGTRFFVEARRSVDSSVTPAGSEPTAGTAVGVVSGRVKVETEDRAEFLSAGVVRSFTARAARTPKRAELRSPAYHHDPFLDRSVPKRKVRRRRGRTVARSQAVSPERPKPAVAPSEAARPARSAAVVVAPSAEVARGLAQAEDLARKGLHQRALKLYGELLADRSISGSVRSLVRFERARLRARMEDDSAACQTFRTLAKRARGEVQVQAALSLCTCERRKDPCDGLRCLERIANGAVPGARVEAGRLRDELGKKVTCSTHNNEQGVQQNQ